MIIFLQQRPIEILPPVISLLCTLRDIGENVIFLGLMKTDVGEKILKEIGIEYKYYPYDVVTFHDEPLIRIGQKLTQVFRPYLFRRWVWTQINELQKKNHDAVVWSSEMVSAAVLGNKALEFGKRHIQSLYELGDETGRNFWGFDTSRMYKTATLIECEYNRAHILKAEKGIARLPFVIPNKPYGHPLKRKLSISDRYALEVVRMWRGHRVFLYQGTLQSDRGSLVQLLKALCIYNPNAIVAVMGKRTALIEEMVATHKNFSYVPFVPPPHHLEITSHADVGIAYYQGGAVWGLSPLNPVYCAPNKIYEYAGFGMPILCNDIPGLKYSVGQAEAGICLSDVSESSVAEASKKILQEYDIYSSNARGFFESVDNVGEIKKILAYARS